MEAESSWRLNMTDTDFIDKLQRIGWKKSRESFSGGLWISGATNNYVETEVTAAGHTLHKARSLVIKRVKEREKWRSNT